MTNPQPPSGHDERERKLDRDRLAYEYAVKTHGDDIAWEPDRAYSTLAFKAGHDAATKAAEEEIALLKDALAQQGVDCGKALEDKETHYRRALNRSRVFRQAFKEKLEEIAALKAEVERLKDERVEDAQLQARTQRDLNLQRAVTSRKIEENEQLQQQLSSLRSEVAEARALLDVLRKPAEELQREARANGVEAGIQDAIRTLGGTYPFYASAVQILEVKLKRIQAARGGE